MENKCYSNEDWTRCEYEKLFFSQPTKIKDIKNINTAEMKKEKEKMAN